MEFISISQEYLYALGVFAVAFFALQLIRIVFFSRLSKFFAKTKNNWDDIFSQAISRFSWLFYAVIALFATTYLAKLPKTAEHIIQQASLVIMVYYIALAASIFFGQLIEHYLQQKNGNRNKDPGIIQLIQLFARILVWTLAVLLILQNLGYNITTLIGGLGIAGVAVGLALQNILGDIFSFFSIYLDRPFQVGDFIVIGQDAGTVKKIGIKSTRLSSLQGQQLIVPNQELTSTRINNYRQMSRRRISFKFGVVYHTPTAKLRKIPKIITQILKKIEPVELDRIHLKSLDQSALVFEAVYYIKSSDYLAYMDCQQEINLQLLEQFKKENIELAFPTQTVYLEQGNHS